MVIFYKKWEKYNEIQFTKNKMYLNNQKMTNHHVFKSKMKNIKAQPEFELKLGL